MQGVTNSTGIRTNWINYLLYIKGSAQLTHYSPSEHKLYRAVSWSARHRSYIIVQILKCKIPERVLLIGAICKQFSKVSCRWRCTACCPLLFFLILVRNFYHVDWMRRWRWWCNFLSLSLTLSRAQYFAGTSQKTTSILTAWIDGFHSDVIRLQSQKSKVLRILIYTRLKIIRK